MNLFYLLHTKKHSDIAALYDDQRCIKIILECCQLLYTAWRILNRYRPTEEIPDHPSRAYRGTHHSHPLSVWTRRCPRTYQFVADHCEALLLEYDRRFKPKRNHACVEHLYWLMVNKPDPEQFPYSNAEGWVPMPQCMPDKYKVCPLDRWENVAEAYWRYFLAEKVPDARWWHRTPPKRILTFLTPEQLTPPSDEEKQRQRLETRKRRSPSPE